MTIEQTEPDPYSIALRRLEKVLRETNAVAIVGWIDDMTNRAAERAGGLKEPEWDGGQCRFPMPASVMRRRRWGPTKKLTARVTRKGDGEPVRLPW